MKPLPHPRQVVQPPAPAAKPPRAAAPPPVFRPVVQAKRAPAPVQALPPRPAPPAPAPVARPTSAPSRGALVVQSFWLEQHGSTTWQTGPLDRTKYQDSGKKKWESSWKPAFINSKLPVYKPIPVPKPVSRPSAAKSATSAPSATAGASASSSSSSSVETRWIEEAYEGGKERYGENWVGYKKSLRLPTHLDNKLFIGRLEAAYRDGMAKKPLVKPDLSGPTHVPGKAAKKASTSTPQERHDNKVNITVANLLAALDGAVGKYEKYGKGDMSAQAVKREGCVKFGPDFPVEASVQQDVYDAMVAMEGGHRAGGRLHVVDGFGKNPPHNYNVTLHGAYLADNPLTEANLHIM